MIRAQNDFYCVVENYGAERNANNDNTLEEYEKGNLTLGEMQRAAENICKFATRTFVFQRPVDKGGKTLYYKPLEEVPACNMEHVMNAKQGCHADFRIENKPKETILEIFVLVHRGNVVASVEIIRLGIVISESMEHCEKASFPIFFIIVSIPFFCYLPRKAQIAA